MRGGVFKASLPNLIAAEDDEKRVLVVSSDIHNARQPWVSAILRTTRHREVHSEEDAKEWPGTEFSPRNEANCPRPALFNWFTLHSARRDGTYAVDGRSLNVIVGDRYGTVHEDRMKVIGAVARATFSHGDEFLRPDWLALPRIRDPLVRGTLLRYRATPIEWRPAVVLSNTVLMARHRYRIGLILPLREVSLADDDDYPGLARMAIQMDGRLDRYDAIPQACQVVRLDPALREARSVLTAKGKIVRFDADNMQIALTSVLSHLGVPA